MATFEIYRGGIDGAVIKWRLRGDDRSVIAVSGATEVYPTAGAARNTIDAIRMDCRSAEIVDLTGE